MSHQKKRNSVGYWLDLLWYCDILYDEKGWQSANQGSRTADFFEKRGGKKMRINPKTRWLFMLLAFMLVLTCTAPALAEQATPAQAEETEPAGAHSIVEKTYT